MDYVLIWILNRQVSGYVPNIISVRPYCVIISKTKATKPNLSVLWTYVWNNSPTYGLPLFQTFAPYEFNKPNQSSKIRKHTTDLMNIYQHMSQLCDERPEDCGGINSMHSKTSATDRRWGNTNAWQTTSVKTSFDGLQDSKWIFLKDRLLIQ